MAYQAEREEVEVKKFIDYKDVPYLKEFTNAHAKILAKKRTGIPARDRYHARALPGAQAVRPGVDKKKNPRPVGPRVFLLA